MQILNSVETQPSHRYWPLDLEQPGRVDESAYACCVIVLQVVAFPGSEAFRNTIASWQSSSCSSHASGTGQVDSEETLQYAVKEA